MKSWAKQYKVLKLGTRAKKTSETEQQGHLLVFVNFSSPKHSIFTIYIYKSSSPGVLCMVDSSHSWDIYTWAEETIQSCLVEMPQWVKWFLHRHEWPSNTWCDSESHEDSTAAGQRSNQTEPPDGHSATFGFDVPFHMLHVWMDFIIC